MKRLRNLLYTFILLSLTSCDIYDFGNQSSTIPSEDSSKESSSTSISYPDVVDLLPVQLREISHTVSMDALPSTGDVTLLVLPIEFTDCPFEAQDLEDLDTVCNGSSADTGYWESVSSFYEKSSFGESRLTFEIADVYKTGLDQRSAYNASISPTIGCDYGMGMIRKAYDNYVKNNGKVAVQNLDSDGNGWIDGIVAVYSGHNYTHYPVNTYDQFSYYWAYTSWLRLNSGYASWTAPSVTLPTPNLYFWFSIDFLYTAVNSPRVDAHTLIHEMGHMYGMDDLYPGDERRGQNFAGGWDMMDENILDHNAYNKLLMGWGNPIVVEEDTTITITPSQEAGDCILVPMDSWDGTAYEEYMLLELYTPTGLNYLDSHSAYPGRRRGYTLPGVKLYHVDSRLLEIKQNRRDSSDVTYSYLEYPSTDIHLSPSPSHNYAYTMSASNHGTPQNGDPNISLLRLIEANKTNDLANGGFGDNNDLFKTGQTFRIQDWKKAFPYADKNGTPLMNNKEYFPFDIHFDYVGAEGATITFTKVR